MIGRKEYWGVASTKYKFNSEILEKGENTISIRFIDVWGKGGLDPDPNRGIYSGEKKITKKTKAIVVVNLFGHIAYLSRLRDCLS